MTASFPKAEKLVSNALIDSLFDKGSHSIVSYPLRLVYNVMSEEKIKQLTIDSRPAASVQVLVSVPKRCFKRAVKRNRVKRQIRDAYRRHKEQVSVKEGQRVIMAFVWLAPELFPTAAIENKVTALLGKIRS